MHRVFKALADRERLRMVDLLREEGARSLGEICRHFPRMSRFGVMKHLRVLKGVRLVVTREEGRFTLHYFNPVPIQTLAERWLANFNPWIAPALTALKNQLEKEGPSCLRKRAMSTKSTSGRRPRKSGRRSRVSTW